MRNQKIKLGIYKHYKGGEYEVLGVSRNSETNEELVVYRATKGEREFWVRPKDMFLELVDVAGKDIPRFEKSDKKQKDFYQISLKIILRNGDKVLGLKAMDNGRFAGFYDFPGGRIDTDEFVTPFEEIITREVKEEIGDVEYELNLTPVAFARDGHPEFGKSKRILYILFEAKYISGDVVISDEHTGLKWIDLEKDDLEQVFSPELLHGVERKFYSKVQHSVF